MTTPVSSLTAAGRLTERSAPFRLVRGLFATALCALLACLSPVTGGALQGALSAGVARAEAPGLVSSGQFGSFGGLGVAVDQSSGDVFVTAFIGPDSKRELILGHSGKFDASGNPLSLSSFPESVYYGAAVNPTNGDLYVASLFGEIGTYDPNTGALLSSFPVPSFFGTGPVEPYLNLAQIATDSAGNVYVSNVPGHEVLEYSPIPACSGSPVECVVLKKFTGSGAHALSGPTGVAVDSSGNVWVADDGNNRIEELSPTGAFLAEIKSEGVRSIALDGHGDVFAIVFNSADDCGGLPSPCGHLVEYSAGGAQLADVGAGDFGAAGLSGGLSGVPPFSLVAVNQASGRAYVTDAEKNVVWIFQPPVLPIIGRDFAAEVGVFEAKLGALATPGGGEATYRFEYLSEAAFQANKESFSGPEEPVSVPFPEGSVGQGFSSRAVWASAKGLEPGTTYHYRAVVTNVLGSVPGSDETFTTETVAQAACPNEQSRGGFSAALPDCRAYEAVVPPNKASAQPLTKNAPYGPIQAANDGNRFTWMSAEVLPGSQSAQGEFLATRGASGWSSESPLPPQYINDDRCTWGGAGVAVFSPDLSKALEKDNGVSGGAGNPCWGGDLFEVVPGETPRVQNLLLRDNTDGAYQLIDVPPPGVRATAAGLIAYSADLSVVMFNNGAKLTPDAPSTGGSYEWNKGVVRFLTFALPSGATVGESLISSMSISPDGSDIFFTAGGDLYVRVKGERTVQLDEAREGSGPGGGGSLAAVTADGSQVFFTDDASAGLTKDTAPGSGTNLYSYDIDTGQLSDLTPVSDAKAALTGISQDGAYVYFTAESVLSGSQVNQFGETAESGQSNLYLSHGGTITFVMHGGSVGLSPNGAFLAFQAHGKAVVYSAAANRFACASCPNPGAEAPTGGGVEGGDGVSNNGQGFFQTAEALLPRDTNGQTDVYEYSYASGLHLITTGTSSSESRLLGSSDSGNDVFFLGRQALLPGESNGESLAIYDARVDGGFPVTAVPVCATADACRTAPAPQPSIFGEPASQTFSGIGNITPSEAKPKAKPKAKPVKCKKGFVKRKGKCVKKPKRKAKKSAHANKRGK